MNIICFLKKSFKLQFNNFVASTPVAGYKFVNCYGNKLQQLFWHAVLNVSLLVILVVGLKFWHQYQNKSMLQVYEILEQGVKLPYPSVYLCLGYPLNPSSLAKYRKNFLKPNFTMTFEEIDHNLQAMLRFQRSSKNDTYNLDKLFCENVDVDQLRKNLLNVLFFKVNELLKDCYFQGRRIECEDIFESIELSPGYCFVFNSIYTKYFHENPLNIQYKELSEFDEDWSIRFKVRKTTAVMMYLKHPRSLLSLNDYPNYVWRPRKESLEYGFTIADHNTEEKLRSISSSRRKCLFWDETFSNNDLKAEFGSNFYNEDVCFNYCHILNFIELCNCMPTHGKRIFPKLANKSKTCTFNDMKCYENSYLSIRRNDCKECLSNCNNTVYASKPEIHERRKFIKTPSLQLDYHDFSIDLVYWPVLHLRNINIFTTTELLLSIVSTASLFLGTSLITFIEAFYYLFIRYPLSYFVNREYYERAIKQREEIERKKPIPCINMSLKPSVKQK